MAYVVSITARPPARYDAKPWTQVRIEQSATEAGPWTILETNALDPIDTDAAAPAVRSVTTELATSERGWHRLVFLDATGDEAPTEAVTRGITPTLEEVAALVPAYTVAAYGAPGGGTELGTFTADTTPTAAQVEQLIKQAEGDLKYRIGDETAMPPNELRRLITLRTAALVIASRNDGVGEPAANPWMAMYLAAVESLGADQATDRTVTSALVSSPMTQPPYSTDPFLLL